MSVCRFCDHKAPAGARNCPSCGGELPYLEEDADSTRPVPPPASAGLDAAHLNQIFDLLAAGKRPQAVALYSIRAGVDVATAHQAVEALASRGVARPRRRIGVGGFVLILWVAMGVLSALLT